MQFNYQLLDLPVLEQIIDPSPLKVSPQTPIIDVLSLMSQIHNSSCKLISSELSQSNNLGHSQKVDCALVMEGSKLIGIFTEQDLVRLAATELSLRETTIAQVMTHKLITLTLSEAQNLFSILSLLRQHKIRHLPILNDQGQLLGLVSSQKIRSILQPSHLLKLWRVCDVMVTEVIHAHKKASVLRIAQLMADYGISCVVIVEQDGGSSLIKPVGIITERDIVQFKVLELNLAQVQAQSVMSHPLFSLKSTDSLWIAQQEMQHRHIRRLVVTGEQGELLGIVTQTSFLQVFDPLELSSMIAVFQEMVERQTIELNNINEQLRQTQQELEKQVNERTAELSLANQLLQQQINERQLVEQKIREQAELLNITTDAICVYDLSHQIIFWNKGCERLYGWPEEEALGKNASQLFYRENTSQFSAALKTVLETGEWYGELQKLGKNQKTVIVASRWTAIKDQTGKPKSILSVDTDITSKKRLETELSRSQRLESLGRLASSIAHDFNNVLTPILGAVQLLPMVDSLKDENALRMLNIVETNAKRGTELVTQILSFARGVEVQKSPVLLEQLFSELETTLRTTFSESINIVIDINPKNLWCVLADSTQLYQVFLNICINARDAMPNGGTLCIRAKNFYIDESYSRMYLDAHIGRYVLVTISDRGIGMSCEVLEKIFEPFFTTKSLGRGTGLGLATALGIVKNHDGFVHVYSKVDRGSQFQIFLPATPGEKTSNSEELSEFRGQQELILLVDDEEEMQEITKKTLAMYNYQVITAKDGIEAIALYAQYEEKIQAILMDIFLPSLDGFTAIRALQKVNPKVKIIAVSELELNSKSGEYEGFKTLLSKPYTTKELLGTLKLILNYN